jgi:diacylglycerol kinase family enzyme
MYAAPGALLDDGLLEVMTMAHLSRRRFLSSVLPRVFKGTHVELDAVRVFRAAEVAISADRPFTMYADGDPIGELPVRVRAVTGAVNVIVPRDGEPSSAFSAPHPGSAGRPTASESSAGIPPDESPVDP